MFRTTPLERHRVVAQLGTASAGAPRHAAPAPLVGHDRNADAALRRCAPADLALQAAQAVAPYVAAVDVNMGCPVHFSTSGGMGAALLKQPERAADILTTLVRALPCPVTAKIRLLGAHVQQARL